MSLTCLVTRTGGRARTATEILLTRAVLLITGVLLAALALNCTSATPPSGPGDVTVTQTTTSTTTSIPTTTTTTTTTTSTVAPLPDLALFTPTGNYCVTVTGASNAFGNVTVEVINQGRGTAVDFVTRLSYQLYNAFPPSGPTTVVNVRTPRLAPGVLLALTFPNTFACGFPEHRCAFTINVDADRSVAETDEANNIAAGDCATANLNSRPAAK